MHKVHGHVVGTAVEARAGFLGRPVLMVLVASTTLVVIGFLFAYSEHFFR
jgi:hypothetical protein